MRVPPDVSPSSAAPSAAELFDALSRLPPRTAQLLRYRVLEARPASECARLYGTSETAVAVHVLRAARLLSTALCTREKKVLLPTDETPAREDEELRAAMAVGRALDAGVEPDEVTGRLLRLRALAPEVQRIAEERARADAASPARRRADWLRRVALAALVGLALWLYFRGR